LQPSQTLSPSHQQKTRDAAGCTGHPAAKLFFVTEADAREYPCLRPVEAIPDRASGRVFLRDPTQLASGILAVGQEQLFLLSLLDGTRRCLDIQAAFARRVGKLLLSSELEELLDQLERAGFLDWP